MSADVTERMVGLMNGWMDGWMKEGRGLNKQIVQVKK